MLKWLGFCREIFETVRMDIRKEVFGLVTLSLHQDIFEIVKLGLLYQEIFETVVLL